MKKFLLTFAIALTATLSYAQRTTDVSVTMTSPTASTKIRTGVPFSIDLIVGNAGPDVIKTTDTLLYVLGLGNNVYPNTAVYLKLKNNLAMGDTAHFTVAGQTVSGGNGGALSICAYAVLFNRALPDSTNDDVLGGNNRSCVTLTYSGTGIGEVTAGNQFTSHAYPSPASANLNVEFSADANEAVTLEIYDMQGRLVSTTANTTLVSGTQTVQVNVADMSKGIYFYKLVKGSEVSSNKFVVE